MSVSLVHSMPARTRNKFCLSLDNSTSNTSSIATHLHRWSEVVPPKNALTFAALWDPDDGMVTFSGASLLEPESISGTDIFGDDQSQFISIDRDVDGGPTLDENTATLSTFQDVFKAFVRRASLDSREHLNTKLPGQGAPRAMQTRASSTFDGLDVYSHDVQVKSGQSVQLSCMDLLDLESSFRSSTSFAKLCLRSDLMLDSCRSEESEPCSENRPTNLKSRFSTTTTSTSNYIDVTSSAGHSARISETLPIPESPIPEWTQSSGSASPAGSWPYLPRRRGVLRKRRPFDGDTTTATSSIPSTPRKVLTPVSSMSPFPSPQFPTSKVLSSSSLAMGEERLGHGRFPLPASGLASPPSTPPSTPSKSPRLKLFAFRPKRKLRRPSPDTDGWVCIEVTPFIRQHLVANPDED